MKKILIIGTPRSGTTTLMNAIAYGLKYRPLNEPFNPRVQFNEYRPEMTGIVLKTLSHHTTFQKLDELINEFDLTILLSRRDREAAWESECNGNQRKKEIIDKDGYYNGFELWHEPYVHDPKSMDLTLKNEVNLKMDNLVNYSYHSGLPIIWYEDIYSNDINVAKTAFESINLGIKYEDVLLYMSPDKRYRKDTRILF